MAPHSPADGFLVLNQLLPEIGRGEVGSAGVAEAQELVDPLAEVEAPRVDLGHGHFSAFLLSTTQQASPFASS